MTSLLIKLFVKDDGSGGSAVRARYGVLSGAVGIAVNVILCVMKIAAGGVTNSIAITADAFNNLSDAGGSVVTLFGFRLSLKPADDEHPFGHGRLETICALIVSMIVLVMGVELVKSSVGRIRSPEPVVFGVVPLVILAVSILGKLWLALFYVKIGRRIDSSAVSAVVADSLGDTAATSVTIVSLVLSRFTSLPFDGYLGLVVAGFIFAAGIGVLKSAVSALIGNPPTKELVREIEQTVLSFDGIVGVHDMMMHNYGEGNFFGSVHAEVPANIDIMRSHDTIDTAERELKERFGISMTIHLDPIIVDDARINKFYSMTSEIIAAIDPALSFHDFRVVDGPTHTNLIFDVVTPHRYPKGAAELTEEIGRAVKRVNENYYTVLTVEESFV